MKFLRISLIISVFLFTIAVFALSTYPRTPSGRRTAISAQNPFAPTVVFRQNQKSEVQKHLAFIFPFLKSFCKAFYKKRMCLAVVFYLYL